MSYTAIRSHSEPAPTRLVCGVADPLHDGGLTSKAAALCQRLGLELVVLHVMPPPIIAAAPHVAYAVGGADTSELRAARHQLDRLVGGLPIPAQARLEVGDPAERLFAAATPGSLLALGPKPPEARLLGSRVTTTVVAAGACPILLVPSEPRAADGTSVAPEWVRDPIAEARNPRDPVAVTDGSIVCGVDGSPESRAALRVASRLSEQLDLRLIVANVVHAPTSRPLATPARRLLEQIRHDEGLRNAEQRVTSGVPAEALADLADEEDAAFIVVGSRGRGALKAALLGSTSTDLIGIARRPVVVVPAGAAAAAAPLAERD